MPVDKTVVERMDVAVVEDVDAFLQIHRQVQMPRKSVPRPAGKNAHGGFRIDERSADLVDRTITSHRHYDVDALPCSLLCKPCGMTGILCLCDAAVKLFLVKPLFYKTGNAGLADGTLYGVENENDFLLIHCAKIDQRMVYLTKIHIYRL